MDCWCQNINTEIISTCPAPLFFMPMYEFLSEDWKFSKPHIKLQWLLRPLRPFHLLKNEISLLFIGLKPPKFDLYLAHLYPSKLSILQVKDRKFRVSHQNISFVRSFIKVSQINWFCKCIYREIINFEGHKGKRIYMWVIEKFFPCHPLFSLFCSLPILGKRAFLKTCKKTDILLN